MQWKISKNITHIMVQNSKTNEKHKKTAKVPIQHNKRHQNNEKVVSLANSMHHGHTDWSGHLGIWPKGWFHDI